MELKLTINTFILKGNESLTIPNNNGNSKLHVSKSNPNLNNEPVLNTIKQQEQQQLQTQTSSLSSSPQVVSTQSSITSDEYRMKTTFYQAAKTSKSFD